MTTTPFERRATGSGPRIPLAAALFGASVAGAVLTFEGSFQALRDPDWGADAWLGWAVGLAAIAIAGLIAYKVGRGGLVPGNARGASMRALGFGVVSVLLIPVFWLGAYVAFSVASIVVGSQGLGGTRGQRIRSIAGMGLGVLGGAAGVLANLTG